MHISRAADGGLATATSADIVLLTGPFRQSCAHGDSRGGGGVIGGELGSGECVWGLIRLKVHQDRKEKKKKNNE